MRFTINSLMGPTYFASLGSFTFEGLTEYTTEFDDGDYRILDDSVVNGFQTYSFYLKNEALRNIDITNATNLAIIPPQGTIVELTSGHYGLSPELVEEVYPAGSLEPSDFDAGKYTYYYTRNTIGNVSQDPDVFFDEYTLMGPNSVNWDPNVEHYKITALTHVLYLKNSNSFGVGTQIHAIQQGASGIRIRASYNIFNPFIGQYPSSGWTSPEVSKWNVRKGGVLDGTTMFSDLPWNSTGAYSESGWFKGPFIIDVNASGYLPTEPEYEDTNSGFYLINLEYDGTPLVGIAGVQANSEGAITGLSIWACEPEFFDTTAPPAYDGPNSDTNGGNGSFNYSSDKDGDRTGASIRARVSAWNAAVNAFMPGYNKYRMTGTDATAFQEFTSSLVNPNIWEGFRNLYISPISSVITCHLMPERLVHFDATANPQNIRCCGKKCSDSYAPVLTDYHQSIHVGDIDISEVMASFGDYTNCSIHIYLPYIGMQEIGPAACMGPKERSGYISIDYAAEAMSGDITATITVKDRNNTQWKRYEYKGNCAYPIPLQTYTPLSTRLANAVGNTLLQGGLNMATNAVSGAFGGRSMSNTIANAFAKDWGLSTTDIGLENVGSAGARAGGAYGALSSGLQSIGSVGTSAINAALSGSDVQSCNAASGQCTSAINDQCWILITRPVWSNPINYARELGYPSDLGGIISQFKGLFVADTVELQNIPCTDQERAEIEQLLKNGVYLDHTEEIEPEPET